VVFNEGLNGEKATDLQTLPRLIAKLTERSPDALLLQEGINDLNSGVGPNTLTNGLRQLVREGRRRGLPVFLGTLLPERVGSCRAGAPDLVNPANAQIRAMATAEGAVVVDLNQAFTGQLSTLLAEDGLHPSDAGYVRIGEVFFDTLKQQLEVPSTFLGR
jgi:lysophospholipase L1-like esterase